MNYVKKKIEIFAKKIEIFAKKIEIFAKKIVYGYKLVEPRLPNIIIWAVDVAPWFVGFMYRSLLDRLFKILVVLHDSVHTSLFLLQIFREFLTHLVIKHGGSCSVRLQKICEYLK
jgi:hypothetical protein